MDQNIIILVLLLIAILVAFYSAYLALDTSKKVRRVQSEMKETLTALNNSMNMPGPNLEEPRNELPRTNLEELNQFPSLDDIENYELKGNMEPLPEDLKKELDNFDGLNNQEENVEENNVEEVNNQEEVNNVEEVNNEEENLDNEEENNLEEVNNQEEDVEEENNEEENVEENVEEENNEEEDELVEEIYTEKNPDLNLENLNLEDELEMPETDVDTANDNNKTELESKPKTVGNELWSMEDITEEYLQGLNDKLIKEICKRENLRIRGTKSEKIDRILKQKNYQVNLN